jgi:peptidoglycan hydrolase CwlO-like protein
MKKFFLCFLAFSLFSLTALFFLTQTVQADQITDLQQKISELESALEAVGKQKDSLSREIALLDNRIKITTLQATQTTVQIETLEKEIELLSGKIVRLDDSLNHLSKVLLSRISETYKKGKPDFITLFLSSKNFSEFISRYRYLQAMQSHDREMLLAMEQTRTSYDEQKQLKEKKQAELENLKKQLEAQKVQLNAQVNSRQRLLEETKGKEANYQKLLAEAREELEAILGILAGKGKEVEIKKVSEGERIASVIAGPSCNSSGTHLHFMVSEGGQTKNPFNYLKGGIDYENCTGSSCGSGDGDAFNPSGSWNWPLNPKIKLTQGYGYTWAIQHFSWLKRIYNFHNGLDLQGANLEVKAVKPGTLYAGSYNGSCTLKYVRVRHDEGNIDTYYLHVNY